MTPNTYVNAGDSRRAQHLKSLAFMANKRAKSSDGEARKEFYRLKHSAINRLLKTDAAFVDSVDWSDPDATIGVTFRSGGMLHMKLSALDLASFRSVRLQISRCFGFDAQTQ